MIHLYSERVKGKTRGFLVTAGVFAALLIAFAAALNAAGRRLEKQQAQLLSDSLARASVTCFSVEGRYPPSLDYLTGQYGVTYDRERYMVVYDIFASNIAPVIDVREVGARAE